jgi:hypothetical protein
MDSAGFVVARSAGGGMRVDGHRVRHVPSQPSASDLKMPEAKPVFSHEIELLNSKARFQAREVAVENDASSGNSIGLERSRPTGRATPEM